MAVAIATVIARALLDLAIRSVNHQFDLVLAGLFTSGRDRFSCEG